MISVTLMDRFFQNPVWSQISRFANSRVFYLASFIMSYIFVFLFPVEIAGPFMMFKKTAFVLIPLCLFFWWYQETRHHWFLILCLIVLLYSLVFHRMDAVGEWILVSWALFSTYYNKQFGITKKMYLGFLGMHLLLIILNFFLYENLTRESIGGLDPNYSALLIFLTVPFFLKSRSYFMLICLLGLGSLTNSRAFMLSSLLLIISEILSFKFTKLRKFKNFCMIAISAFLALIAYSYYGVSRGLESYKHFPNSAERYLNIFNNYSDYFRWKANTIFFDHSLSDLFFALKGDLPNDYFQSKFRFMPHNLPLLELATHGWVLGLCFLTVYVVLLRKVFNELYFSFYVALIGFWLFLGVEIGSIYTVFFICGLNLLNHLHIDSQKERLS